ncbi:MAG: flagellar brake protein [Acidimicrobiia bacterium]
MSPSERFHGYLAERPRVRFRLPIALAHREATIEELNIGRAIHLRLEGSTDAFVNLPPGTLVEASFSRSMDASYRFAASIAGVRGQVLYLAWPDAIEREQSRRHVRLPIDIAMGYAMAGPRRLDSTLPGWRSARTLDVSGCGMRVVTEDPLDPGAVVIAQLDMPGRQSDVRLQVRAKVVRRFRAGDSQTYGLEFSDLSTKEEENIVGSVLWMLSRRR